MALTLQLLLTLLIAGGIGITFANERAKRNIQELQALLGGLGTPSVSNPRPPAMLGLSPLNPRVSVNPTLSNIPQTPSNNPSTTTGIVAASEESGEGKHRNPNRGNGHRHKPGSGSHENHHTGSHSDESKRNTGRPIPGSNSHESHIHHRSHRPGSAGVSYHSGCHSDESRGNSRIHRPQYGHIYYHGSHSAEGREYPRRYRTGSGEVIHYTGSHSDESSLTRSRPHRPRYSINIHDKDSGSHKRQSSSEDSRDSSSSSSGDDSDENKVESPKYKRKGRHSYGESRSKESSRRRPGRHHDSSSNSSE